MKRIIIIVLLVLTGITSSFAQQLPQFTQYMYNTISINPAYAGSREALSIVALNRNQWAGFDGGPQTMTLSAHTPLNNEKVGVGLSFVKDKLGYQEFTSIYADFSYTIQGTEKMEISFGLKAGATNYKLDDDLFSIQGSSVGNLLEYQSIIDDPYFNEKLNTWNMNIGAGILFHTNKWYVGLSTPRIINHDNSTSDIYESLDRVHYYFTGGYVFDLSKSIKFKPAYMVKYVKGAALSTDVTANFLYNEKFWLGASYRINDVQRAFGMIADFQVSRQFRVGYAYEIPTGEIRAYTNGSHEILLMYEFKFLKNNQKSPRYF